MEKKLISYLPEHRELYSNILKRKHQLYVNLLNEPDVYGKEFWDVIVITAIDESQQKYYEQQLDEKLARKEIPSSSKYHVIPDPVGPKIGCGGSTLVVLDFLEKKYGNMMDSYKVLLIHAGGYSKRLANHSISGKIFCPIPYFLSPASPCCTMLEMKFLLFIDFPKKMNAGVFLTCADDIELFESEGSDFTQPGVTALAHPSTTDIGLTHGVFVLDKEETRNFDSSNLRPRKCIRYLHKPTMETMEQAGAILKGEDYEVFVDSNYFFDRSVEKLLLEFYHRINLDCEVDAYGDFLQPLGENAVDTYFANTRTTGSAANSSLLEKREQLYHLFRGTESTKLTRINVIPFVPSLFIHIGTCKEYIEHLCENLPEFGYQRFTFSHIIKSNDNPLPNSPLISPTSCIQYSVLSDSVMVEERAVVEYCTIMTETPVRIGKNTILSQVSLPESVNEIVGDILMHTLVLRENAQSDVFFITLLFGIDDDLKAGGKEVFLRDVSVAQLAIQLNLTLDQIFENNQDKRSLWNAKLFPVCKTPEESAEYAFKLLNVLDAIRTKSPSIPSLDFSHLKLTSLVSAIEQKDMHAQSYYFRTKQEQLISFLKMKELFKKETDVLSWMNELPLVSGYINTISNVHTNELILKQSKDNLDTFLKNCIDNLESQNRLEKGRATFSVSAFISEISKRFQENHPNRKYYNDWAVNLHKKAYSHLRDATVQPFLEKLTETEPNNFLLNRCVLKKGMSAQSKLPARIILAGGWSDTPPFCLEKGGDIVNVAIKINGKLPIVSTATVIEEKVIRLKSVDTNFELEVKLNELNKLFTYEDPSQSLSLHKACISFVLFNRFVTGEAFQSIESLDSEILRKHAEIYLGEYGLEITTDVDIPKGSGLGTSSILMLSCVKALRNLWQISSESHQAMTEEFNAVLAIEQMLTTGGGWQDQVGGGTPGLKFITSEPSNYPDYLIKPVEFDQSHVDYFNDRLLVVYTGKTRLAAPILWNIVDNYQMRRTGTKEILQEIKAKASEMNQMFTDFAKRDLIKNEKSVHGDFNRLGACLESVKKLNFELERTITNDYLDELFASLAQFVTGSHIIGAGSGGYIVGWMREGMNKEQVRKHLREKHPNSEVTEMTICTSLSQ